MQNNKGCIYVYIFPLLHFILEREFYDIHICLQTCHTLKQLRYVIKRGSEVGPLKANPLLQYYYYYYYYLFNCNWVVARWQ
jgi:hypothetical protein